jgi:hypothetical protein
MTDEKYEYFDDGRPIEAGDEFYSDTFHFWIPTVYGRGVESDKGWLYRRRKSTALERECKTCGRQSFKNPCPADTSDCEDNGFKNWIPKDCAGLAAENPSKGWKRHVDEWHQYCRIHGD